MIKLCFPPRFLPVFFITGKDILFHRVVFCQLLNTSNRGVLASSHVWLIIIIRQVRFFIAASKRTPNIMFQPNGWRNRSSGILVAAFKFQPEHPNLPGNSFLYEDFCLFPSIFVFTEKTCLKWGFYLLICAHLQIEVNHLNGRQMRYLCL